MKCERNAFCEKFEILTDFEEFKQTHQINLTLILVIWRVDRGPKEALEQNFQHNNCYRKEQKRKNKSEYLTLKVSKFREIDNTVGL